MPQEEQTQEEELLGLFNQMQELDTDEIELVVQHTGLKPGPGPTTISEEGFEKLMVQIRFFIGARIMAQLDQGKSVEEVKVNLKLDLGEEVSS